MDAEIISMLEKNPLQNLPLLGFFKNYPLEKTFKEDDVVLLTGTSDFTWAYISGSSPAALRNVLDAYGYQSPYFANVEDWMLPVITHERPMEWKLTTIRYYLTFDKPVAPPAEPCKPLSIDMVPYIFENSSYKDFTSESYIRDRLEKDISAGIWRDDALVGWGMTHDDSSLGFLNVLKNFQGKGLGENLLRCLIHQKREQNQPVFVNIEPHNHQSINLVTKLGFTQDRQVSWLKLK
jgi:GNAT superfamily N-acetyltransferase